MTEARYCTQCGAPLAGGEPKGLCARCLLRRGMESQTAGFSESAGSAKSWEPPTAADLSAQFPDVEVLELIGRGGMGAVYKARQKNLDRIVALKILPPAIGDDPAFADRFTREAKALARLNHPSIVTLYEFGRTDSGLYYFLMEFVDGVNLRHLIDAGRVAPREALAIVPQVCDALQYAHDHGVVHRDIKPENILLDRLGRVKVADFGLAKIAGQGGQGGQDDAAAASAAKGQALGTPAPLPLPPLPITEAGKVVGTPHYMAPEQLSRPAEVDHRADIYALGVVFYQMLTGELPTAALEPPSRKVQIDIRLDEVVMRAMETDPERRYSQASAMKTQVETIASDPNTSQRAGPSSAGSAIHGAKTPRLSTRAHWTLIVFGLLDLGIVVDYAHRIPADIRSFNEQPWLTSICFLVLASLVASGYGLLRMRPWALILNYIQFPFRVALAFVSFGWLAEWLAPQNSPGQLHEIIWVSTVALEGIRLGVSIMIHRELLRRSHNLPPQLPDVPIRTSGIRRGLVNLLLFCMLVIVPAIVAYDLLRSLDPPLYMSTGLLAVHSPSGGETVQSLERRQAAVVDRITSTSNLDQTLEQAGKDLGPDHIPPITSVEASRRLTVRPYPQSRLIIVSYTDPDPWVSQAVVQALMASSGVNTADGGLPDLPNRAIDSPLVTGVTCAVGVIGLCMFFLFIRRRPTRDTVVRLGQNTPYAVTIPAAYAGRFWPRYLLIGLNDRARFVYS